MMTSRERVRKVLNRERLTAFQRLGRAIRRDACAHYNRLKRVLGVDDPRRAFAPI